MTPNFYEKLATDKVTIEKERESEYENMNKS